MAAHVFETKRNLGNETSETPVFPNLSFAVCESLVNAGCVMQKPFRNRSCLGHQSFLVFAFSSVDQEEKCQTCFVRLCMGSMAAASGEPLEVVAVEGEPAETVPNPDMPEGTAPAPEGTGSHKKEEAAETEEPPNKKARTSEMSPELESKFLKLMEQTRQGFECTGKALSSVQEHVELLKKHSKELSDLASEIHVSRVSEKYYLSQLQSLYAAFGQIEWQLAGPKSESNTSMKSVLNKLLGSNTSIKEGMKALHEEFKQGQGKVVEAIEKGFGTLCQALVKQPITVRDGPGGGSSSAYPPAVPPMPAMPAMPPNPGYGLPGYASAPPMTAPLTPRNPPVVMPSGSAGATGSAASEGSEARAPLVLIAADEAGNRKRIAVSPTRHQNTQHLNTSYLHEFGLGCVAAHQGFYHRRLPDVFLPK